MLLGKPPSDIFLCDAIFYQTIHKSRIEVVACANGAHSFGVAHRILSFYSSLSPYFHWVGSLGIYEVVAIEGNIRPIYTVGIIALEEYREILIATPHHVGIFKIVQKIRGDFHHLVAVGGTEVNVVVYYRSVVLGIFKKSRHLRADHGIDGIERAEHHNIVRLDIGIDEVELVVRVVLIEDVFRVIVLV